MHMHTEKRTKSNTLKSIFRRSAISSLYRTDIYSQYLYKVSVSIPNDLDDLKNSVQFLLCIIPVYTWTQTLAGSSLAISHFGQASERQLPKFTAFQFLNTTLQIEGFLIFYTTQHDTFASISEDTTEFQKFNQILKTDSFLQ